VIIQNRLSSPEGLCELFLNECGWSGTSENIARFTDAIDSLEPSLREKTVLALSSRSGEYLENQRGVTSMGGYFLQLSPEEWVELITGEQDGKPRRNLEYACFFARHAKEKLLEILPDIQGQAGFYQGVFYGDVVAIRLYHQGLMEAESTAISSIQSITSEFKRFLVWRDLCEVDFERHKEDARLAAYESLAGSPRENNWHVPARWLAENFPDEALPKLAEMIRNSENDSRSFANWPMVAHEVLVSLGTRANSILEACADTTCSGLVRSGVMGAIRGGYRPPNATISNMLRRLLKVDDVRERANTAELIGIWNPEEFVEELEGLATTASAPEEMQTARMVLARHEGTKRGLSEPNLDSFILARLIANTPLETYESLLESALKPCLHLRTRRTKTPPKAGESKVGGIPSLPVGVDWPRTAYGTPMVFIARISVQDIRLVDPDFKRSLLFFADWEQMQAGVVPVEEGVDCLAALVPDDLMARLTECALGIQMNNCLPQRDDDDALKFLGLDAVSHKHHELFREVLLQFEGREPCERTAVHRMFGYPRFTQASPIPSHDPGQPDEWMSILSMETDEAAELYFNDTGTMTFSIRRVDWENLDFGSVQLWVDYM
jgi:uncharacterized protein YwqG